MRHRSRREKRQLRAVRRKQTPRYPKTRSKERKLTYRDIIDGRKKENPANPHFRYRERVYMREVAERGCARFLEWLAETIEDLEQDLQELLATPMPALALRGVDPWTGEPFAHDRALEEYYDTLGATRKTLAVARQWQEFVPAAVEKHLCSQLPEIFALAVGEQFLEENPDWFTFETPNSKKKKILRKTREGISWDKPATPLGLFLIALSKKVPDFIIFQRASSYIPGLWYQCPGKVTFSSEIQAKTALADIARKRRSGGRTNKGEVRTYWCMVCRGWHLTSREETRG